MTDLGGKKYKPDFYTKIHIEKSKGRYSVGYEISKNKSMILTYCDAGESNDQKFEEKENFTVSKSKRVLIPIKIITDKKYIKVTSTINGFYWDYLYSLLNDTNYLPQKKDRTTMHFQRGNVVYINNPYAYSKLKTNFYWFIFIIHDNDEVSIMNYEYTNEKEGEKKGGGNSNKA